MKCTDIEDLLCDYVDGTLGDAGRSAVDSHASACAACAALLADSRAAVEFMASVEDVEGPPELVTRILYRTQGEDRPPEKRVGRFAKFFQAILQPRFAMGMAMTILSFSMIGRMAGIQPRPLTAADLEPARIWSAIDTRAHRAYDRVVKYVDNLRLVYEIQNRLGQWSAEEEQALAEQGRKNRQVEPAIPAVAPDQREKKK